MGWPGTVGPWCRQRSPSGRPRRDRPRPADRRGACLPVLRRDEAAAGGRGRRDHDRRALLGRPRPCRDSLRRPDPTC